MIFTLTDEENLAICILQEENEAFLLEEDLLFLLPEQSNCTTTEDTLCVLEDEFGDFLFTEIPETIFVEFCSTNTIIKVFSNSQQECIDRTFRVEGKCKTAPAACNLPACSSTFVTNIFACNVEDVLTKIASKNLTSPINKIQVFDNNNCLSDVNLTAIIADCDDSDICDLFVDEHPLEDVDVVTTVTTHDTYTARDSLTISGGATYSYSVNGGEYVYAGSGIVYLSSDAENANSYWTYTGNGSISLSSNTQSSLKANYSYDGSGNVYLYSITQVGTNYIGSGSIGLSSGTTYSLDYSMVMSGSVVLGSNSTYISPNYTYVGSSFIFLDSESTYFNNDYGTVEFDFIYEDEIALDIANFIFEEADDIFLPIVEDLNICDVDISSVLQVRHNLNLLSSLKYYLLRNGLRFDEVFQMQYNRRLNAWTANFHFGTVWNLLFDLSCNGEDWQFSMTINYTDVYDSVVRFVVTFDKSDFIPDEKFEDFSFEFDFTTLDVAKFFVFRDDGGIFSNFPDNLIFEIYENSARDEFLDTQDEELPQASARQPVGV